MYAKSPTFILILTLFCVQFLSGNCEYRHRAIQRLEPCEIAIWRYDFYVFIFLNDLIAYLSALEELRLKYLYD